MGEGARFCFLNQDLQDYGDLQDWDDADASFYGYRTKSGMTAARSICPVDSVVSSRKM